MKIIEYTRDRPKIQEVFIKYDPLIVWLDKYVELRIDKGDRLSEVVKAVRPYYPQLSKDQVVQLVAYWFAMGERARDGRLRDDWQEKEYRKRGGRRYLVGGKRKQV